MLQQTNSSHSSILTKIEAFCMWITCGVSISKQAGFYAQIIEGFFGLCLELLVFSWWRFVYMMISYQDM